MLDSDFVAPGLGDGRDTAIPRFYTRAKKNEFRSQQEGRPVFDNREYVEILIPGDKLCTVDREVKSEDMNRWPRQYAAFKNNQVLAPEGTPLEHWTMIDPAQVEHLKHFNVRSVEQLASVSDATLSNLGMGSRELQAKAKVWLAQARDNSGLSKLLAENEQLQAKTRALEEQVGELARLSSARTAAFSHEPAPAQPAADMAAMIAAAVAQAMAAQQPAKSKGGRPRKAAAEPDPIMPEDGED